MLASRVYSGCATFFLQELYSERDYGDRDAQFAKVAGAIELTFPPQVVDVAVTLAELHKATEELDLKMANNWSNLAHETPATRYMAAWRLVGQRQLREWQLATVLTIGRELTVLTQKRGLRLLLKMMRKPAELAGLGDLQHFLESGFDHFGGLSKNQVAAGHFLQAIQMRENLWIAYLFDDSNDTHKAKKNAQSSDWAFMALGA